MKESTAVENLDRQGLAEVSIKAADFLIELAALLKQSAQEIAQTEGECNETLH